MNKKATLVLMMAAVFLGMSIGAYAGGNRDSGGMTIHCWGEPG